MNIGKLAFSIEEAAEMSDIGRTRIFAAIGSGQLVARKHGRRTLVLRADLERFLASLPIREPNDGEQTA
ncbi:helix-turn-helix domain-containing protein [Mesorhizobium sp. B4-1-4]|uniref:helix-turn-helix domain-containing protein n=1 Tax=Mesorhizobium sp. B4-1-4 TaxID=2589888 RepID=UPI00112767E7|nr:helix-turn-helix domain-containing protein [Mesorhizobium sp. B4-1-4]UCI33217.1 helix-turn-helix domain-containing protein [Mesorhizobium sp. B4-1-4]